eukprot:TRINITY_DN776_c0_g1_i2.p1 TRINITY_DN776_c0_g1~~TRINITY_DN776_c0_g1_i2.p1  ORF type:complete len:451 (-),score=109.64 TRINITY_DN776_c0_g1_i2:38-1351(-)
MSRTEEETVIHDGHESQHPVVQGEVDSEIHLSPLADSSIMIDSSSDSPVIRSSEKSGLLGNDRRDEWQLDMATFSGMKRTDDQIKAMSKKSRAYYRNQSSLVTAYEHSLSAETVDEEEEEAKSLRIKIAIYGSFAVNVFLCGAKLYAAISSGSLAVIASTLDSFLDLLSGSIIFFTAWAMKRTNQYEHPAGKTRLEPLGIIIFAACMFTAAIQIVISGVETLSKGKSELDLTIPTVVIIGLTVVTKLVMFLYCRLQITSPSALALAQDHFNDVASNSVGVTCVLIAYYVPKAWWLDAVGGMLMGLYIMFTWFTNGWEQVQILSGKAAPAEFISKLTYASLNHHRDIMAIDTARAFHLAMGFMVEIDIVLPGDMDLQTAHDIGESLQIKLETWPDVERCFVHLDYETDHKPEHKQHWVGGKLKAAPNTIIDEQADEHQ